MEHDEQPVKRNKVFHLISTHPVGVSIAFIGALASIIGLPMAIYFWQVDARKRELTYQVEPIRTSLVRGNQNTNLTVLYKGSQATGDISVAQVTIANNGETPIESSDIIVPPSIIVSNAHILEYSYSVPPKRGTEFTIEPNATADGITLHWKILERGDNPVIQVLYSGPVDAPIFMDGRIKGQSAITILRQNPMFHLVAGFGITILLSLIGGNFAATAGISLIVRLKNRNVSKWSRWLLGLSLALLLGVLTVLLSHLLFRWAVPKNVAAARIILLK